MIKLRARLNPMTSETIALDVEPGRTIVEIVDDLAAMTRTPIAHFAYAAVMVNEVKVPLDVWNLVRPKSGTHVVINVLPGDDFGSLFVTLAGLALAAFVPPIGAFAIGGVNVGQFVVRAAISLGTMLISQAIAPTPRQITGSRNDPAPVSYSITGTRNQAKPYDAVPVVYGRVTRFHPPYAALPYTETWGGDLQFIRMLLCCEGVTQFSNIKIGDTPVGNLKNFNYELRSGLPTDSHPTLFPRQVREESLSVELRYVNGYTYRTTQADTDEVSIEVIFPNGMGRVTDRNVKFGIEVKFKVMYFGPGLSSYVGAPLQQDIGGGVTIYSDGVFSVSGYSKATVRRSVRFRLPTRGQYSVGIARITIDDQSDNVGDNQSTTFETSFLSSIRSIQNEPPVERTGLAYIAVFAQASEQLNGVIDTLNVTAQRLLPIWNGSSWSAPTATRNPAWAYVDVLKNFAAGFTDDRIDLATILTWANLCDSLGLTFDAVVENVNDVWALLGDIAASGFASPTVVDDKYSVIIDHLKTEYVQVFSSRNVSNFQVQKLFAEFPHALKVRFPNEATDGQIDEFLIYDEGYSEANASIIEALDLPFTRTYTTAYKMARRYLVTARLRPRIMSFDTSIDAIVCQRGSLIRVQHPTPLIGTGAARVRQLTYDGSLNVTHVTLDAPMETDAALDYEMRVQLFDGSSLLLPVVVAGGLEATYELVTPIASGDPKPSIGNHVIFGLSGLSSRDMVVRSIEWREDLRATITCVDYSPEIFTSLTGPIPDFDPGISLPPVTSRKAPPKPIVVSVTSDEDALIRLSDGTLLPRILIAYELRHTSDMLHAIRVVVRWREYGTAQDPEYRYMPATAGIVSISPVEEGTRYLVEIRSESEFGATSEWVAIDHTVEGARALPPSVETLYRARDKMVWPYDDPPIDLLGFRVKAHYGTSTDWPTARLLTTVPITITEFDIEEYDGVQTFLVKAVDIRGNESAEAATLTINLGDPFVENVILTSDEHPTWAGSKTNCSVSSGNLVADSSIEFWPPDSNVFWLADGATFWPTDVYKTMTYVARYVPLSDHVGATIKLEIDVDAGVYAVDYRTSTSPDFWGLDASTFWGSDGDAFWAAEIFGAWKPWPGVLGPIGSTSEEYDVRLTVEGGFTQGDVNEFSVLVDVPDIEEFFESFVIASSGTVRLPLTNTYRVIDNIQMTREDDGGSAVEVYYVDKDATNGPEVRARNAAGTRVSGTADIRIKGH